MVMTDEALAAAIHEAHSLMNRTSSEHSAYRHLCEHFEALLWIQLGRAAKDDTPQLQNE